MNEYEKTLHSMKKYFDPRWNQTEKNIGQMLTKISQLINEYIR
jgi:hypothetical protein